MKTGSNHTKNDKYNAYSWVACSKDCEKDLEERGKGKTKLIQNNLQPRGHYYP